MNYKITGIQVFLERRASRQYVGLLRKEGNQFYFEYDMKYLKGRDVIPLGPEMPLTKRIYQSDTLFIPFTDRFPSRENPAYPEYCKEMNISVEENDPFILLSTIASRGPSSFVFEPFYDEGFTGDDLLAFRKSLGLSIREFASCFDFSAATVSRVEHKLFSGRDMLKRAEIYAHRPEVALDQIRYKGGLLHPSKFKNAESYLINRIKDEIRKNQKKLAQIAALVPLSSTETPKEISPEEQEILLQICPRQLFLLKAVKDKG